MNDLSTSSSPLTKEWAMLLKEFARPPMKALGRDEPDFERLLTGFLGAEKKSVVREAAQAKSDEREFETLLGGYVDVFLHWRKLQTTRADDFNLIELLGLVSDENRHSNVLAWLLNSDIYHATHSQGNLGFKIFLDELKLSTDYADGPYFVGREVQGRESRVDIEIFSPCKFIIHIEAKIDSGEGVAQLKREWSDLGRRAKSDQCNVPNENVYAYFLTRRGETPSNSNFKPLSWETIAKIFENFSVQAKAESVRWFARHYAEALRKYIVLNNDKESGNE